MQKLDLQECSSKTFERFLKGLESLLCNATTIVSDEFSSNSFICGPSSKEEVPELSGAFSGSESSPKHAACISIPVSFLDAEFSLF